MSAVLECRGDFKRWRACAFSRAVSLPWRCHSRRGKARVGPNPCWLKRPIPDCQQIPARGVVVPCPALKIPCWDFGVYVLVEATTGAQATVSVGFFLWLGSGSPRADFAIYGNSLQISLIQGKQVKNGYNPGRKPRCCGPGQTSRLFEAVQVRWADSHRLDPLRHHAVLREPRLCRVGANSPDITVG